MQPPSAGQFKYSGARHKNISRLAPVDLFLIVAINGKGRQLRDEFNECRRLRSGMF